MATRTWQVELSGNTHTLTLDHSYWLGKRALIIDGVRQKLKAPLFNLGSSHPFLVDGHECVARIRYNGFTYRYDMEVDGVSLTTGQAATEPAVQPPLPRWAWAFVVACGLIPLVMAGGALPAVIGVVGATQCMAVARRPTLGSPAKVALCAGIVVASWGALLAMILAVASLTGPRPN